MATEHGTATNHLDLLSRLHSFLLAQGWVADLWDGTGGVLVAHGPGQSGANEVYIGMQAYADAGLNEYGWNLQGFTGYEAGLGFAQPGRIAYTPPILPLWDSSLPYWFVASGRRVVVVAQVSTVFTAAYLGLLKAYGSPGQYQYPLAVGGTGTGYASRRWSATDTDARHFTDPGAYNATTMRTGLQVLFGSWLGVRNVAGISSVVSAADRFVWPFVNKHRSAPGATPAASDTGGVGASVQAHDGSVVLTPLIVGVLSPSRELFGELEGCFHVSGQGLAAGDRVTVSGTEHLVVPNLYRAGRSDYWALALE